MGAGRAVLGPADVEDGGTEFDLIPAKVAQFRRSKAMPKSDHYHGGIPVPVPVRLGRLDQCPDVARRQVLSGAKLGVRMPYRDNCSIYTNSRAAGMRLVPRAPELVLMPVDPLVRVQVCGCPAPKDGKKDPTAKSITRRVTIYPVEKNAIPHYDRFCAGTATPGILTLTVPRTVRLTK